LGRITELNFWKLGIATTLFVTINVFAQDPPKCSVTIDGCDFYSCRDQIAKCGADGYYLGYGYKYCKLFNEETFPKMSEKGRIWLSQVRQCLQSQLLNELPESSSCKDAQKFAISSHSDCYAPPDNQSLSFCNLDFQDKLNVYRTLDGDFKSKMGVLILQIERCIF
jgi:hypothetical protein